MNETNRYFKRIWVNFSSYQHCIKPKSFKLRGLARESNRSDSEG